MEVTLAVFVVLTLVGAGFTIAFTNMLTQRSEERTAWEKERKAFQETVSHQGLDKQERQREEEKQKLEHQEKFRRDQEDRVPALRRRRLEKELALHRLDVTHLEEQIEEVRRDEMALLANVAESDGHASTV